MLINQHGLKVLGFLTVEHFDDPQLERHVSVYLPEPYNFAGNFIVSGRATDMSAAKAAIDPANC